MDQDEAERRIAELEDELKARDRRIEELKREVDEGRDLVRRMEEHVEDRNGIGAQAHTRCAPPARQRLTQGQERPAQGSQGPEISDWVVKYLKALIYYSGSRVPGTPSFLGGLMAKLTRARRAYYARRRRPLKIEVPGPERVIYRDGKEPPTVVEKEVVRYIDQIVLIPRSGIRELISVVPGGFGNSIRASNSLG